MTAKRKYTIDENRVEPIGINSRLFTCMGCTYFRELRSGKGFQARILVLPGYGEISQLRLAKFDIAQHNCRKYVKRLLELRAIWDGNGPGSATDRGHRGNVGASAYPAGSVLYEEWNDRVRGDAERVDPAADRRVGSEGS